MEFIHIFQYGLIFNKITVSNINLLKKAFLLPLQYCQLRGFIEVKLLQKITISRNNHLIKKFSNFSQYYLSLVNFFCIHMKCIHHLY